MSLSLNRTSRGSGRILGLGKEFSSTKLELWTPGPGFRETYTTGAR